MMDDWLDAFEDKPFAPFHWLRTRMNRLISHLRAGRVPPCPYKYPGCTDGNRCWDCSLDYSD